jgi:4,5-dihydroxyphthalate decarboxylase
LPYGITPNRKVLEELIRHATIQGIVTIPQSVDELFAPTTRGLVA